MARYVLQPGWVVSQNDGQRHYIGAGQLRELYAVPGDAQVFVIDGSHGGRPFRCQPGDIHCVARFDGKYPTLKEPR